MESPIEEAHAVTAARLNIFPSFPTPSNMRTPQLQLPNVKPSQAELELCFDQQQNK